MDAESKEYLDLVRPLVKEWANPDNFAYTLFSNERRWLFTGQTVKGVDDYIMDFIENMYVGWRR